MFHQNFLSPQVKRYAIITYKHNLPPIDCKWYATYFINMALSKSNIRVNKCTEFAKDPLIMAADSVDSRGNADHLSILNSHTESLRAKHS